MKAYYTLIRLGKITFNTEYFKKSLKYYYREENLVFISMDGFSMNYTGDLEDFKITGITSTSHDEICVTFETPDDALNYEKYLNRILTSVMGEE